MWGRKGKAPGLMLSTLPSLSIDTSAKAEGNSPSTWMIANQAGGKKPFAEIHATKRHSKVMGGCAVAFDVTTIPQADLDRIRGSFPKVLEYYGINPRRHFSNRESEKGPSSSYSAKYGIVKDFGGKNYNVFEFVGAKEGLENFQDQVSKAAEIIGLRVGSGTARTRASYKAKASRPRFVAQDKAGFNPRAIEEFDHARRELFENETAINYLLSRGFDRPNNWRNLLGWVPDRKIIENEDGSTMFTLYEPNAEHGFIVLPFMNHEAITASDCMLRTIPEQKPHNNKNWVLHATSLRCFVNG